MKLRAAFGFTLVELMVVITILSILGTIGFAAMSSWSTSSRNAVRIADLGTISRGLEIFIATHSRYPDPENATTITFSGASVWTQGLFGSTAIQGMASLSEPPRDPLDEGLYAYSVTTQGNEYELGAMVESGSYISAHPIYSQAYADSPRTLIVNGNYNGNAIFVNDGHGLHYLLAVPTILATNIVSTDLLQIIENSRLAISGRGTPPHGFGVAQSEYVNFNNSTPNNIIVWSGALDALDTSEEKLNIARGLKLAYSDSTISSAEHERFSSIDTAGNPEDAKFVVEGLLIGVLKLDEFVSYGAGASGSGLGTSDTCSFGFSQFGYCHF